MLRSVTLKTLRDQRWPLLAWSAGLAALVLLSATALARAYPDAAARQVLARQVGSGLSAAQVLYGRPVNVDRFSGLIEWRVLGLYPVLIGVFLVIAATAATRGAEERGELDLVLVASRGRGRLFVQQATGLLLLLTVACLSVWAALLLCGGAAGERALDPGRAALTVLNIGLAAALFAAFALLLAQVMPTRRAAAFAAGGALFAAHLWSNLGLVAASLSGVRWLSPLYLTSRSTPLANGRVDGAALLLLALLTLACGAAACWLFVHRDLGATATVPLPPSLARLVGRLRPAKEQRSSTRLLGGRLQRGVRTALAAALAWGVALAVYAALITALTPAVIRAIGEQANAQQFVGRLGRGDAGSAVGYLGLALFGLLPLLIAIYAATLAAGWSAEEQAGRLELELACPTPRRPYFAECVGAALVLIAVVVLLAGAGFAVTAGLAGVRLPWDRAIAAVLLLAPLAAVVAAFGYALSAWRPASVSAVLAIVLGVSYVLDLIAPLFGLPDATRYLSIFHLYGQPLAGGVSWGSITVMVALAALFIAAGGAAFARRDVAKA